MANKNIDLIEALDKIRLENLYVHNDELPGIYFTTPELRLRKVYLVETLAVINALVDRGTMLLYGGHGGGKTTLVKYLGQLFYHYSKNDIEKCILRGHKHLTEEKILGTLRFAQILGKEDLEDGQIKVDWNSFVDEKWKIIDELNRMSPSGQNILLSLLAESSVKYHNESKLLSPFSLYATMNPKDEGNEFLALPFLDRFALALPITMPDYESLSTIGRKDKSSKQDDLSSYLKEFEIKAVQDEIKDIKYSEDAELFINVIISSYGLCDRIGKGANETITVEKGLCNGCHFDAPEKVCNKIVHPLSVRVKEDLYRYGKALAWILGDNEVTVLHIKSLAPFMIWHRSSVSKKYKKELYEKRIEKSIYAVNIELEATKELINKIENEFEGLKPLLKQFDKVKKGKLSKEQFELYIMEIQKPNNNFLITKKEITPILLKDYNGVYKQIVDYNNRIDQARIDKAGGLESLNLIKKELSHRYDIPNRQFLADIIEKERRKIGAKFMEKEIFSLSFENIVNSIEAKCPELYKLIKSRYPNEFNPPLRKEEVLADVGESDYSLRMQKVNKGSGQFGLIFDYLGNFDNSIYKFLKGENGK